LRGLYIIFEGADGTGKSTTMKLVAKMLPDALIANGLENRPIELTYHPGSTPLGKHIRKLVKNSEEIDPNIEIDPLSRQMLYTIDLISFTKSLLKPALADNKWVFADRSNLVSAIAYGSAEDVSIEQIQRLFTMVTIPKADRLYIFRCPPKIAIDRVRKTRVGKDYFDDKPDDFFEKIIDIYDNFLTGPPERTMALAKSVALENVKYIDSSMSLHHVASEIVQDLIALIKERVVCSGK